MRCGPGSAQRPIQRVGELLGGVDPVGSTPSPPLSLTKSRVRVAQVHERRRRLGPISSPSRLPSSVSRIRVAAVVEDDDGDVELLSRHRPQRLDGVERRAIGLQCDHRSVRTRDRRPHGDGQALADRSAREREPVVAGSTDRAGRERRRRCDGFVREDRALGERRAHHLADLLRREGALGPRRRDRAVWVAGWRRPHPVPPPAPPGHRPRRTPAARARAAGRRLAPASCARPRRQTTRRALERRPG